MLSAITSAQQRLKLYSRCPTNGLVLYCGEVMTDDGKVKKVSIDFEPFKPINTSLYLCDNKFHTEALSDLLQARCVLSSAFRSGGDGAHGACVRVVAAGAPPPPPFSTRTPPCRTRRASALL